MAFACLTDDQYPERVAFMVLKKMASEFAVKYEGGQFSKIESMSLVKQKIQM